MEPDGNATDGAECWKYVFSGAYQGYQNLFEQSQATMDPNNIAALLHEYPYHVDALLAMHELYRCALLNMAAWLCGAAAERAHARVSETPGVF